MIIFFAMAALIVSIVVIFSSTIVSIFAFSIMSLFVTILYLVLNAPDVAITEAAAGSAISTIFFLLALRAIYNNIGKMKYYSKESRLKTCLNNMRIAGSGSIFIVFTIILSVGIIDAFVEISGVEGATKYSATYYIENSYAETGIKNIVTSVLASYRGFDTLIENLVILTAAMGVYSILGTQDVVHKGSDE